MKRLIVVALAALMVLLLPGSASAARTCQPLASWTGKIACAYVPTAQNSNPAPGWYRASFLAATDALTGAGRRVQITSTAQYLVGITFVDAGVSPYSDGPQTYPWCWPANSCTFPFLQAYVFTSLSQGPGAGCHWWRTKATSVAALTGYPTTTRITYSNYVYFCS